MHDEVLDADDELEYACTTCPSSVRNPLLSRLLHVMAMQDGGAPVPWEWLNPPEWAMIAELKRVRDAHFDPKETDGWRPGSQHNTHR